MINLNDYMDFAFGTYYVGGKAGNLNAVTGTSLVWFIGMPHNDRMISKQKQG